MKLPNPELSCFIKLIDFAPSDHTVKSCFSLEHFVIGAAMMNGCNIIGPQNNENK